LRNRKKTKENKSLSFKVEHTSKHWRNIRAMIVSTSSLVKEARSSTADTNKACTNNKSRENKYNCGELESIGKTCA